MRVNCRQNGVGLRGGMGVSTQRRVEAETHGGLGGGNGLDVLLLRAGMTIGVRGATGLWVIAATSPAPNVGGFSVKY